MFLYGWWKDARLEMGRAKKTKVRAFHGGADSLPLLFLCRERGGAFYPAKLCVLRVNVG